MVDSSRYSRFFILYLGSKVKLVVHVLSEGGRLVGVQWGEGTPFSQALLCEVLSVKEATFLTCWPIRGCFLTRRPIRGCLTSSPTNQRLRS